MRTAPWKPGGRSVARHWAFIERENRACLAVPLWFCEEVGGSLFFAKRQPAWYDGSDVEVASAIAAQVVVALQHQRLAEEQQHRAIHHSSPRAEEPYVAINCAALPETLVESELFGHERGAFTGADKQKPGRFELAAGGTLFLDEVAELSPSVQAKPLRVLPGARVPARGGTATLRADVRLITATNQDPARAVKEGKFREDLFYRLNVFSVHLPPLRERGDDILLLANHFVRKLGARIGGGEPGLSRDAQDVLRAYRWPGNIRELANAIERALILADGGLLTAGHLGVGGAGEQRSEGASGQAVGNGKETALESLATLEQRAILAALDYTRSNKTQAAALLGITRTQLHTRLKRFGLASESAV